MNDSKRWYVYRKVNKDGSIIDIKRNEPMLLCWLKGWTFLTIVDYEVIKKRK